MILVMMMMTLYDTGHGDDQGDHDGKNSLDEIDSYDHHTHG